MDTIVVDKKTILQSCVNILGELSLTEEDVSFIIDELDLAERATNSIIKFNKNGVLDALKENK